MTNTGSWTINNKTVQSLTIGNKEIQSIERVSDGAILYQKNTSPTPTPASMSVTATKDVLSKHHSDTSTLTATVLDANNNACVGETVTFKNGSTVLGTDTTDSNGEAEYTYTATGGGNITISIECASLTETYNLEDIFLAILEEHSNTGSWSSVETNIGTLPSQFELTAELYTTGVSQGAEQRLFLCPSSTWNGSSQPSQGIWIGFNRPNNVEYGYRNNGSNWFIYQIANMNNNYHTFKVVRNNSSYSFYIDNTLMATKSYGNMSNYSSFTLCWINWASGTTFKFKNFKLKAV